ncbi:carbon storage regulator [uncultured Photobacterium sp.]|uniref:carbon storage regulator n=1 Tax=uncultured Photobacterium sp. TaxID=173973 RepID=UPI002603D2BF|nr:carbon storage regulator [uncultured Photobacterium sp.]
MKYLTLIAIALISSGVVAEELDILANSETLSENMMNHSRGGQYELKIDNIHASSDMYGDVAGNGAYNNTTGDNVIDASSFSDSSGVLNVVQNTGNNVLIQNATVVNLTLK